MARERRAVGPGERRVVIRDARRRRNAGPRAGVRARTRNGRGIGSSVRIMAGGPRRQQGYTIGRERGEPGSTGTPPRFQRFMSLLALTVCSPWSPSKTTVGPEKNPSSSVTTPLVPALIDGEITVRTSSHARTLSPLRNICQPPDKLHATAHRRVERMARVRGTALLARTVNAGSP